MKIRRKHSICQNCGCLLDRNFNYCPECGQENDDKNVSFGKVFKDFLDTFFALDGSFFRTLKPFIIRPGFLTLEYISGRRKSYANPIRIYLIISVFFFSTIGIVGRTMVKNNTSYTIGDDLVATDSLVSHFSDVLKIDSLENREKKKLLKKTFKDLPFKEQTKLMDKLDDDDTQQLFDLGLADYSSFNYGGINPANFSPDSAQYAKKARDTTAFILNRLNEQKIRELDYKGNYTDGQILDSMRLEGTLKWWEEYLAIQKIRIERGGGEAVTDYIIKNLPLMMLLVIPIFALVLKLVYIRRKHLYVQHLIHGLHLHSFAYLIYGLANLVLVYLIESDAIGFFFALATFIGVSTYAYVSFLRFYKQGWFKTVIKFNLVGWIYMFTITIFFVIEALVSFLMF
jgi:hypothetical protein